MRLCVRGQDIAWTTIGVSDDKGKIVHSIRLETRPETILNAIVSELKTWKIDWKEIRSIAAVSGTGSFTSARSSLTIVNTIAFVWGIPMASVVTKPEVADELVLKKLARVKAKPSAWLVPHYGAKPHITKPKSSKS